MLFRSIPNAMKAAAYDALNEAGVEDPESIVEAMFLKAEDMFNELDEKAAEYNEMDDSGIAATQKMLASMGVQAASAAKPSATAAAMRQRLAASSLPITAGIPGAVLPDTTQPQQLVGGVDRSLIRAGLKRH